MFDNNKPDVKGAEKTTFPLTSVLSPKGEEVAISIFPFSPFGGEGWDEGVLELKAACYAD